jgi:hypothetical protein
VIPTRWRDTPAGALTLTLVRLIAVSPALLLGLTLCFTFIGIPVGLVLMGLASKWATRPMMRLPQLNVDGDAE